MVDRNIKEKSQIIEFQLLGIFKSVRDEIRTHTAERPLPPQSSVSTNSTTRTNIKPMLRAKNGTRTRDPNLGKVVLYQLSYFRVFGKFKRCHFRFALQRYALILYRANISSIFNCC